MTTEAPPAPILGRPGSAPLGGVRRTVREVGLALITAGAIILLFIVYQLFGTNLTEASNQASLARGFRSELGVRAPARLPSLPRSTVPPGSVPPGSAGSGDNSTVGAAPAVSAPPGGAIDHLVIPKLGLSKYVVDGTSEGDLSKGPGHYPGTPYPGQKGNVGVAGHRTTYGAPFYRLNELGPGDSIYFTDTTGTTYRYQVDATPQVVAPSDVAVLDPTPDATLTLTTCNPRFSATSRLVVKARLVGKPLPQAPVVATPVARSPSPTPPVPPTAPPRTLTGGNHSAWPPTLLYGAAVLVLWVGTRLAINRTRRTRRAASFVGGVALCCVPLWLCFENVVRLLPQSI